MKVVRFIARNFRSIKETLMDPCGGFNVLIGKNNSGKSNLLSAIDHFFSFFGQKQIASIDVRIDPKIDFHNKNPSIPIELTTYFQLDLSERDALLNDIATEAPQMKKAVEGLDPTLLLAVSITIVSSPIKSAYVSSVTLTPDREGESETPSEAYVLLQVPAEISTDLAERLLKTKDLDIKINYFSALNEEISPYNWSDLKEEVERKREPYLLFRSIGLRYRAPIHILEEVALIIDEADSYQQFQLAFQTRIDEYKKEKERIVGAPLRTHLQHLWEIPKLSQSIF